MQIKKINGEEKIRMESKLIIDVPDEETGERIDSFLSGKTDFTRTRIQQLIKDRNITVNGKPTKSSYKIEENDEIIIEVPEVETTEIKPENIKGVKAKFDAVLLISFLYFVIIFFHKLPLLWRGLFPLVSQRLWGLFLHNLDKSNCLYFLK